jgi:hypothetical protein
MVQTTDDTEQTKKTEPKKRVTSKKTAEEVEEEQQTVDTAEQDPEFITARPEGMDTAAINSAPHPELWPSPDTDPDAEADNPEITVVPEAPSTNFEYTIKASGLPPNSGVVFRLDWTDNTGEPTFLTHKTDPQGVAHVVWRSQHAGKNSVSIVEKNDHELGSEIASHDYEIVDPAEDRRMGEARGHA